MADKYNKPRRNVGQSTRGGFFSRRSNQNKTIGNGMKAGNRSYESSELSISDNHRRLRIICLSIFAILSIITLIYLFTTDNSKHHHFQQKSFTNDANNANNGNNLLTIEEIGKLDHINTARVRNTLSSQTLKPLIQNTAHDVHIVFSSGCSEYQNWQSEVLLYSWARLNHPGQITRLVSGCKTPAERLLASKTAIISERVHLYFAPDFTPPNSGGHNPFHYFNKPYSMQLWLQDTSIDIAESYIILIDPDMIITRVFDIVHDPDIAPYLSEGHPMSQKYGIGPKWTKWGVCTKIGTDCEPGSITDREAWDYYSVGPPYMMHINDWRLFINKWVELSPPALEKDPPPSILAEMYSFAMASAYYNLRHKLVYTMLSDPDASMSNDEEPWGEIKWDWNSLESDEYEGISPKEPNYVMKGESSARILHYCHGYWLGDDRPHGHVTNFGFNFHKGHLPKDILHNCEVPLLVEPPTDSLAMMRDHNKRKHHVWMLYQVITRINSALANYKHLYCGPGWVPKFKTVLVQPEGDKKHRMHYYIDTL